MNVKIGDTHISEERYIEIKQMAYKFYEEYNKLDRVSRKKYLDALPKLNTPTYIKDFINAISNSIA